MKYTTILFILLEGIIAIIWILANSTNILFSFCLAIIAIIAILIMYFTYLTDSRYDD